MASPGPVCGGSEGQTCVGEHRQHLCGVLHKQARGGPLLLPVPEGRGDSVVVPGTSDSSDSQILARKVECPSRRAQPFAHDTSNGVDACPQSSGTYLEPVVQAACRPLRNEIQQEVTSVCFAGTGSRGMGGGRSFGLVERSAGVCLPSLCHSRKGYLKGKGGPSISDSHSSSLGVKVMVSGAPQPHAPRPSSSQVGEKGSSSAKVRDPARRPKCAKSPRVVSVRESLSMRGASDDVIELVEHAHRPGTKKVYKARWISWCAWCKKNGVTVNSPSHVDLANYLAYLSKVRRLSASAVKGHRAAISTTLRQMGLPSFSDDPLLKDVVKGVALKEARCPKRFPAWDVFLVLQCLRLSPFEPIDSCELKLLTHKTVFLIALASGRRCSEVHALAYSGLATEQDGSVSIRFLPEFLAKNQPSSVQAKPILIRRLASLLCPDDEDITLCPVRALKMYLKRTKFLRTPAKRRLFVSFREDKRSDISSPSISRWIKSVIQSAYSTTEVDEASKSSRAHEVRAWAASLAWANNASLQSIMEAGYWFSQATFIQFYLRDVSHERMDGTRAISFVAAQLPVVTSKGGSKDDSRRRGSKHAKSSL